MMVGEQNFIVANIVLALILSIALAFVVRTIVLRNRLDSDAKAGNILLSVIFFSIGGFVLYEVWTESINEVKHSNIYYPDECKMMHDDEEVRIKHPKFTYSVTGHIDYLRVIDSNFYVEETKFYNYFGEEIDQSLKLVIFDNKEKEEGPISIDL
jgi:hypothetical protein